MSYAIFRQAAQPKLALRVLERAVEPATLARLAWATGRLPGRRSAVELARRRVPFVSASAELLQTAVTRSEDPALPARLDPAAGDARGDAHGATRPGTAAAHAAELIEAITGLPIVRHREAVGTAMTEPRCERFDIAG